MSRDDRIWNRAALEAGGMEPRDGDKALAALLLSHGMVMNGGVAHAVESLSPEEFAAAIEGFRYFGFDSSANFLAEAAAAATTDAEFALLNKQYAAAIPSDDTLVHAFRVKLLSDPELFAPLAT